jgi:hypothetical protein
MELVETFIKMPDLDLLAVKYPGATVLLDLSANENCIEKVAQIIKDKGLFDVIIRELDAAIIRKVPKCSPDKI